MDNVIFVGEYTFTNTSTYNSSIYTTIPHSLPFKPLAFGNFSLDGGNTWQDIDFEIRQGYGFINSYADNFTISITHPTVASTIKVRLYAFPPSTYANYNFAKPNPISRFYINTNNTYDNIIASGLVTLSASGSEQVIYTHNLGYTPRVMLWRENNYTGAISRIYYSTSGVEEPIVNNTQLKFLTYYETAKIHYRIYGGSNG